MLRSNPRSQDVPEPGTDPPIDDPEPAPPPIQEPEYPLDPGPAEDPEKHPARGDPSIQPESKIPLTLGGRRGQLYPGATGF